MLRRRFHIWFIFWISKLKRNEMSNSSVENQITRQIMYQLDCSRCMLRTTVIYLTSIDLRSRKRYKECNNMHTNTRTPFDPASQRICGWNRKCKLEITNEFSRSRNDFQVENIWRKKNHLKCGNWVYRFFYQPPIYVILFESMRVTVRFVAVEKWIL